MHAPREKVQRHDLAGDAVPVTLRCPAAAKRPCRSFLRLTSRKRYLMGPAALPRPVTFASRVRPVDVPDTSEAGIAPGQTKVVCVPVDQGQRGLLRNTPPLEEPRALMQGTGKRPLPFDLTVSPDEAGRNIVRFELYYVSVTRPDEPIEYWGECSSLRLSCRAEAGTRAREAVECTVTGTRPFAGRLAVTVVSNRVRHARGTAVMDGRQQSMNLRVTRPLRLGEQYQAIALLAARAGARERSGPTSVRAPAPEA